jgi:integrase
MNTRYRLIFRGVRGGMYYCVDKRSGKRTSLQTTNEDEARQIIEAKNAAERQPVLNLQIAKAYIAGTDSGIAIRTWQNVLDTIVQSKKGSTQLRWRTAANDKAFDRIRNRVVVETTGEELLEVLKTGTVSTNVHLRKLHNYCLGMNWLPWPLLPKKQWPAIEYGVKRAITLAEHQAILERERNPEWRAFYALLWQTGGSQTDVATLTAGDIDWNSRVISYRRQKTGSMSQLRFGEELETVLRSLPSSGPLFPKLSLWHEKHRAKDFKRRCTGLNIKGITLHSYRYAWAERALKAGYPERFAQLALGHNSKAVHRAYAKAAQVTLPPLEEYENKIVTLPVAVNQ